MEVTSQKEPYCVLLFAPFLICNLRWAMSGSDFLLLCMIVFKRLFSSLPAGNSPCVLWVCACAWNMFMQTLGARWGDFSYQRGQPHSLKVKLSAFPDHVSHSWNSLHIRPGQKVCFMDAAWEGYLEPAWYVWTMSCIDLNRTWFKMSMKLWQPLVSLISNWINASPGLMFAFL